MKFYDCRIAPSPRRVRMFLAEKGIEIETVEVDLIAGENLGAAFLNISPRGMVPSLQLDDGTCIDEAVAICRYIEELHPEPCLMGRDARSRAIIESRNRHMEIDGFLPASEAFRNSAPVFAERGLPGVTDKVAAIPQLAERGIAGIRRYFDRLERALSTQQFVAGNEFSIADITALCVVDFAGWVKEKIPDTHVHAKRWYAAVSARPSAKA